MAQSRQGRFDGRLARLCACAFALSWSAAAGAAVFPCGVAGASRAAQDERLDIRMRSFTPGATGRITVEPSLSGGRGRLTALNLPDPQALSRGARTYVVWATSGGRIVRLGELRLDERGNGGLAYERPADFDRYTVIVTAEAEAAVERPGAPVLSTRAGEARPLYGPTPAAPADVAAGATPTPTAPATTTPPTTPPMAPPASRPSTRPRRLAGDFYAEVEDALLAEGGGRVIELEGEPSSPAAKGTARAATHTGSAYVRANFRGVPLPSTVGAGTYVLWAIIPDGRIIYMGSLPVTEDLNEAEIYVRTGGFGADAFNLFVTAERGRPVPAPSTQRVLTPKTAKVIIK